MAHVIRDDGSITAVKNLSWLQRHADEARTINVHSNGLDGNEATLLVNGEGWLFYSPFASRSVLLGWIARRRGLVHAAVWDRPEISVTLADLRAAVAAEARS